MKKIILIFFLIYSFHDVFSQLSWQGGTTPEETDSAILLFDATGTTLESYTGTIYAHTGVTIDGTTHWVNVIGDWGNNTNQPALTLESGEIYSLDLTPTIQSFYSNPTGAITAIDIVLRADIGSPQSADLNIIVGAFQTTLTNPAVNSVSILNSGDNLNITATNTGGNANYVLKANGSTINSQSNIASYSHTHTNITTNQNYELEVTLNTTTITKKFSVIIDPGTIWEMMTTDYLDGINYHDGDPTKVTLVLDAPLKDFVYVAGSFNNWQPDGSSFMKRDFSRNNKFWIELTGLTSGQIETYQYWVVDKTPIVNSSTLVKTADPYSTLVLSPFDDPWIPALTYPSLPAYPIGQEREVTVIQTGQTPYSWVVPNFTKPKKEDLIIYEVLIRDFDADRNYQDLIDRIDYFKNLNVNAIELMPVMEFEGNESWGYNTSFHMALDKFYGTEDKFREFVDVCHQNGIAVILDLALNHAFGRNPMNRMWMNDPDGDGWGEPSSENPYMNQVATHSYSVGSDFNHQSTRTQNYTKRVVKHWIEEFKIDGFRWDLTKGFTQNCSSGNDTCTNNYQADRVAVLKDYADYSWSLDADHYVIFEHLGGDTEEQEWANYRLDEGKGIMMWSEMWDSYKNLAQGNSSNIDRMGHIAHGFTGKRTLGYPESHDKDRVMYEMIEFGKNTEPSHNVRELNIALKRMSALGAITIPIPGPKMLWHFADLGMDNSIWTCTDGSVNTDYDGNGDGDCKLDTKPQPQWLENWLGDANRKQIYDDWSRLNVLKINEAVFEGDYSITTNTLTPKIYVWDNALLSTDLKDVVILANFDVTTQNITPNFPYTGAWYDLMDDTGSTSINVTNVTTPISIPAGEFRIYGNQNVTLGVENFETNLDLIVYPNPVQNSFFINKNISTLKIFDITGKLIKEFKGDFLKGVPFDISSLTQSLYIIKIINSSGQQQATKLVKF
ncbi:MAG: alpha-amylase [Bacteroidetes bacterium]|nr:MAG: alpha-amylase [Bacteroidota bacterium]